MPDRIRICARSGVVRGVVPIPNCRYTIPCVRTRDGCGVAHAELGRASARAMFGTGAGDGGAGMDTAQTAEENDDRRAGGTRTQVVFWRRLGIGLGW